MKNARSKTAILTLVAGLAVLAAPITPARLHGAETSPLTRLSFEPSMKPGVRDANGKMIAGTEVMHLVPYKGRLYASTSLWMESDPSTPKATQILVLDSPKGQWRIDREFTTNNLRWGSLRTVTFSTNAEGKAIPAVTLLLAAPDVNRGPFKVYCRNDESGQWDESVLGTATRYSTTRAIGFHHDRVTGIDRIFAGTDHLGMIGGVYDPAATARICWDKNSELQTPEGERVMGFCDCNGVFYCATSRHIFQRADGASPTWKEVYFCEKEISPCGIRGLSAVPNPGGSGEVLLFAALSKVRHIDPAADFKEVIELGVPSFVAEKLGHKVNFALIAYNEFLPCTIPGSGEKAWIFGFECTYPPAVAEATPGLKMLCRENPKMYFAGEARYFIRHANGSDIHFELGQVTPSGDPLLVSTRAVAVSPFPEDHGRAYYFSGFDCNYVPSHNTGWICRAELPKQ